MTSGVFFKRFVLGIISIPVFLSLSNLAVKIDRPLSGAFVEPKPLEFTVKNVLNGTFQSQFESYFNYTFPGRPTITRLYNWILYSLFRSTDSEIEVGKNEYLYTPGYQRAYLAEPGAPEVNELKKKMRSLLELQERLYELGKVFLVIITPSKSSFYPEFLPSGYKRYVDMKNIQGTYLPNFYESFIPYADELGIWYYDGHDLLLKEKEQGMDVFVKSGIHWTAPAVALCFKEIIAILDSKTEYPLGTFEVVKETKEWNSPFFTDADLQNNLNIPHFTDLKKLGNIPHLDNVKIFPKYPFFSTHIEVVSNPGVYRPNVYIMGGSFFWSLTALVYEWNNSGIPLFDTTEVSFYNTFMHRFPEDKRYDTVDYAAALEKDIILLEFNEQAIVPDASQFIFVDNLLSLLKEK